MNFLQRKIFVLSFIVFFAFSAVYAADENADDIFEHQKVEEGDFYKIVVEPSKKEIESENAEFFESVKQKKLDILKKIDNEKKKVSSAKSKLALAKENKKAELERNKAKLQNKPVNDGAALEEKKTSAEPSAQMKNTDKPSVQKKVPENQGKNIEKRVPENKKTATAVQDKTVLNKTEKNDERREKFLEQQKKKSQENKTVEESEKDMDDAIDLRKKFIDFGMGYKGINYVWGGKTPVPGFDCSGLVTYTAKKSLGLDVKGNAQDIYNQTSPVSLNDALPGDLIFFKGASDSRITHVGIYLGKNPGENDFGKQNLFLNAASGGPRTGVIISGLNENYWKKTFYGCGRLLPGI